MRTIVLLLTIFFYSNIHGQDSLYQNLYFVKKGEEVQFKENDYIPNKTGFYLYRNCFYNIVLKNKLQINSRIIDIRNDSLYYTIHLNESSAVNYKDKLDTFSLHPSQIRKVRLIGDRIMGLYNSYSLRRSKYFIEQNDKPKKFDTHIKTIYSRDSSQSTPYELVPYLTAQGLDVLYEQCGVTYYYRGISEPKCEDTVKKILAKRKIIWFTPSNTSEINGVNIGLQTSNFQDQPLTIRGVNLSADALSLFVGMMGLFSLGSGNSLINMPDTVDKAYDITNIHGVSLSFGGLVGDNFIKGLSVNVGVCTAIESKGVVITGSQNIIGDFRGISMCLLRNLSIKGAGLQIGLLNICKHLKGVQIGLWNVNSKRKLPFINWSF